MYVNVQTIKYMSLHGAGLICIYSIQATEGYVSLCSTVYTVHVPYNNTRTTHAHHASRQGMPVR